jgi:hypothetical protein
LVVPSSEALAAPLALGATAVVSGGQACAHAPLHALIAPWSASHRYSARPLASTRKVPSELDEVPTTDAGRGELDALTGAGVDAAVVDEDDEEPPQAARRGRRRPPARGERADGS